MSLYTARFFMIAHGIHLFATVTPDDIIYNSLPLYHTNGGILAAGQMLFWGSTLVLRKKFSASNFFTDCVKHKCTVSTEQTVILLTIRCMVMDKVARIKMLTI